MPKDELVYLGHMLDTARRAVVLIEGKERAKITAATKRCGWRCST